MTVEPSERETEIVAGAALPIWVMTMWAPVVLPATQLSPRARLPCLIWTVVVATACAGWTVRASAKSAAKMATRAGIDHLLSVTVLMCFPFSDDLRWERQCVPPELASPHLA